MTYWMVPGGISRTLTQYPLSVITCEANNRISYAAVVICQANSIWNIGWHYGRISRILAQYTFSVLICQANNLLNIGWVQVGLARYYGNIHSVYLFVRLTAYQILDGARSDSPDIYAIFIQDNDLSG